MTFVNIVPIRRMPADRPWLTYSVPAGLTVEVGSLVTMPLRGRPILGVVWAISTNPPSMPVHELSTAHLASPIITTWQKKICDLMADTGSTSLGEVLFRVIPKLTVKRLTAHLSESAPSDNEAAAPSNVLWYRSRRQALDMYHQVFRQHRHRAMAVVTPTKDDADEILSIAEQGGRSAFHLHSQVAPTEYAAWYNRVRNNQPVVMIGSLGVLALPYPGAPVVILDQEEHHAHKQTAQFPHYDARIVINRLHMAYTLTTPAPSLTYYHQHRPTVPPSQPHRRLITLHGPKQAPLLSDAAVDAIDTAIAANRQVLCISPRRGFASATICRACGTALTCPTCGRVASIFRGLGDEARCHTCQTTIPLRTSCTKCAATDWSFQGYGIEQTVSSLQRLRPKLIVTPLLRPEIDFQVAVDTYQAYRSLRRIDRLGAVILTSGDSLVSLPDYSVAERAWQYLARLQAEAPSVPIILQTFEPESPFWQRWVHSDDRRWYDDEIQQRQRLLVPPFVQQWIAAYQGPQTDIQVKIDQLEASYRGQVTVRRLPPRRQAPNKHRLLLSFTDAATVEAMPWTKLFPLPWRLDRHPTSWLD